MTCPWSVFAQANLDFCEKNVCGWIVQPANSWSNIGFIVVAILIYRQSKTKQPSASLLLAPIAFATGLASFAFHATGTFWGQALDQSVMFTESGLFIVFNMRRVFNTTARVLVFAYAGIVSASIALLLVFETAGIALFVAHVVIFLSLELLQSIRMKFSYDYKPLSIVGLLFVSSFFVWWLDKSGALCNPDNHFFGGHAAWHFLGAIFFYYWYAHYSQFDELKYEFV